VRFCLLKEMRKKSKVLNFFSKKKLALGHAESDSHRGGRDWRRGGERDPRVPGRPLIGCA
jgi:hypothetical protein